MEDKRPIKLNSLIFSDKKGAEVFRKDYFMEFATEQIAERYIQHELNTYTDVFGMYLVFRQDMNETLMELEVKRVLRLVCKHKKLRFRDVKSKSQKREYVDARRFAVMICIERGKSRSAICEYMDMDHSTIVHHVKQFNNLSASSSEYRDDFVECSEFVMDQLTPKPLKEDGSGEEKKKPINNHNHEQPGPEGTSQSS